MKTYLILAAVIVAACITCVLVVHYEGQETRRAMRRLSGGELADDVREEIDKTVGGSETRSSRSRDDEEGSRRDKSDDASRDDRDAPRDDKSRDRRENSGDIFDQMRDVLHGPADKSKADPESTGPKSNDPKSKDPKAKDKDQPRGAEGAIDDVFELARQASKSGDEVGQEWVSLSQDEERSWGRKLHDQILRDKHAVDSPSLHSRVENLAAPLLRRRLRRSIDYTFTVLESDPDDINAFSIAGGYIYVNKALIDFTKNDQELQSVLGHEIGHVDLGHCSRSLAYTVRASQIATPLGGNLAGLLHALLARPFSQEQEYEADEYGFYACIAAGQTRDQATSFLRRFGQHLRNQGENKPANIPDESRAATLARRISNHLGSHPAFDDRIRRLEALPLQKPAGK
jgi:hypothetical protein